MEKGREIKLPIEEKIRVNKLPFKLPKKLTQILDGFKWAILYKKQSAVMIVDGRSGMGRTTISFQSAAYISPNFNLSCVHFTPESFIEGLTKVKKGDVIIFDEAMLLSSRAALSTINRMIVIAMSMIRSKNIFVIFNVNSIFDLDRNLALSRADLLLNCYGDSLTDKGRFLAFFKGGDGMDRIKMLYIYGKKFYSYSSPKSNFNSTFSSYFVLNEEEYERTKQIGVNAFLRGTKSPNIKYKKQRNQLIMALKDETEKTYQELSEILEKHGVKLSFQQLSKIYNDTKPKTDEKQGISIQNYEIPMENQGIPMENTEK